MKKLLKITGLLILPIIILSGCSAIGNSDKISIKAQIFPIKFIAESIGGDKVDVSLMSENNDAHHVDLTQQQIADLQTSDAFYYIGVGDLLVNSDVVTSTLKDEVSVDIAQKVDTNGNENEHLWLSLSYLKVMSTQVFDDLVKRDEANKKYFEDNFNKLTTDIDHLQEKLTGVFQQKSNKTMLVEHAAYAYFADEYQLEELPLSTQEGGEISAKRIEEVKDEVANKNISTLFTDAFESSATAKTIAEQLGLKETALTTLEVVNADETRSFLELYEEMAMNIANNI